MRGKESKLPQYGITLVIGPSCTEYVSKLIGEVVVRTSRSRFLQPRRCFLRDDHRDRYRSSSSGDAGISADGSRSLTLKDSSAMKPRNERKAEYLTITSGRRAETSLSWSRRCRKWRISSSREARRGRADSRNGGTYAGRLARD